MVQNSVLGEDRFGGYLGTQANSRFFNCVPFLAPESSGQNGALACPVYASPQFIERLSSKLNEDPNRSGLIACVEI
ncbi:MAG: hypothetical protein ACXWRE_14650 [Pseudobdellovibrionaceae bacterium]